MTVTPEQVSKARWLLGWPLRSLAEVSKLNHSTVMNCDNGKHRPSPSSVAASNSLAASPGVKLRGKDDPKMTEGREPIAIHEGCL
jgi:hypothetical protein